MKNGPYEMVVAPPDYPGKRYRGRYVYEHQLVWWRNTGEVVGEGFIVHHRNHNKRDNSFENLELRSNSEHVREHNLTDRPAKFIELTCAKCGTRFQKSLRNYKAKVKKFGQTDFYCNRSCMAAHFGGNRPKNVPLA